jgi:hypothetical protein
VPQARNLRAVSDRIETLIEEVRTIDDPGVRETAEELVRLLVEFYGAGLARIVEIVQRSPDARPLMTRFERDDLVSSLLVLHDLPPREEAGGPLVQIGSARKGAAPAVPARPREHAGERCELCAQPIVEHHSHLVDTENRNLLCACRACYLLFTHQGAAGGKYRAVPERYLQLSEPVLTEDQWEQAQIPVNLAFFFFNTSLGRTVAFYPSPAGATESLLSLETWQEVERTNPVLAGLTPDVEALLVYKRPAGFEGYVVPIDACYELVGIVRQHWKGFHGGEEAWQAIETFFTSLRERAG